jgi:hypothetical protein
MPEMETLERARKDAAEGKSPSTQAGEFVREEIEHVREAKHGVRSAKQAIAIGLSKARRAGVKLPPPKGSAAIRRKWRKILARRNQNASLPQSDLERQRARCAASRAEEPAAVHFRSKLRKRPRAGDHKAGKEQHKKPLEPAKPPKYCQGFTDRFSTTNREICSVFHLTSAVLSFLSPVISLGGGRTFSDGSHAS